MRIDRTVAVLDNTAMSLSLLSTLYYVQASDGLYVPKCDLRQYEAGNRPVRVTA